ncbi:ATPase, T2SS/T4P/T4SS family [Photobacterium toruni]|uniref:GspE/PulE family protein n=1 Tax=Photobacterium TaxID=657 RepID=UPI001E3B6F45|nr:MULTISPECIES: ATPase, T2SS/T4P/T4SS family [Photobacterium]MCD9504068.1 type II secretion protein [Photobacterium phosphoreum]MEC6816761.1 ATPase, T2SS/T4P/T4SS family [Photobacterium toruni]
MSHAVLRNDLITRLCLDDGHTCVTEQGEILNANAQSAKLDDIIKAVQTLPIMIGKAPNITAVPQEYIETLLETLTQSTTHSTQDKEKESLLGLHLIALCQAAVNKGASDIHVEVYRKLTRYLIRVDGKREVLNRFADGQSALHQDRTKGIDLSSYVFSTLGNQDVNEREPANDSFDVNLVWDNKPKTFEFRAALMPLDRGIKLTLRCLTPRDKPLQLSDMDLPLSYITQLIRAVNQRGGGIVITGPMGSGKSSLIYALLDTIDSTARCIHALEDPVEFEQKGICKTAVEPNTETKLGSGVYKDYAFYAKEQLRHDIDVAPFGELRDHPAAKEFCRKAETGGLAITTLHTNSVLGIPQTFIEQMGISPAIVSAPDLMRLFVHQKLIRKLCPHCALTLHEALENETTKEKALLLQSLLSDDNEHCRIKSPLGCDKCEKKGEKGRVVVMELVVLDDEDRQFIFQQDYLKWKQVLKSKGWPDIRDHTLSRIKRGQVDIQSASEQINDLIPIKSNEIYMNMREEL